jgi:hypothetical protein
VVRGGFAPVALRVGRATALAWVLGVVAGAVVIAGALYLPALVVALGSVAALIVFALSLRGLRHWQVLTTLALAAYIVLDYGFANLALPGLALPVGYALLLLALWLAVMDHRHEIRSLLPAAAREPAVWCAGGLLFLVVAHLVVDMPRFGLYAIRDASFILEAAFALLGFLWARRVDGVASLTGVLAGTFLVNLALGLGFPSLAPALQEMSPVVGVFRDVPLLGAYSGIGLMMLAGAVFFCLLEPRRVRWPRWVTLALVITQLGWLVVVQARAVYLGAILVLVILAVLGHVRRAGRLVVGLVLGVSLVLGVVGFSGSAVSGRVGPVRADFILRHATEFTAMLFRHDLADYARLVGSEDLDASRSSTALRLVWARQAIERWRASASTIIIGEGFGRPLTDFVVPGGAVTRQPHNTHLTVLARLGLTGVLLWVFLIGRVGLLLWQAYRRRASGEDAEGRNLSAWLIVWFGLGLFYTCFQPWLEFSYGGVPFYILTGLAVGLAGRGVGSPLAPGTRR